METTTRLRPDVLVIGAGAIGVNCAYWLARAGQEVTLLDGGRVGGGCSHGNAGLVTPCHSLPIPGPGLIGQSLKWMLRNDSPLYIQPRLSPDLWAWLWRFARHCNDPAQRRGLDAMAALNRHVVPLTGELIARHGFDCQYQARGLHYVFATSKGLDKGLRELQLLQSHGIEGERLDRDGLLAKEPDLRDDVAGGIYYPGEADLVPDLFVKQVGEVLPELGVKLLEQTAVEGFEVSGDVVRRVKTSAGSLSPGTVVLAAGAWSTSLARRLGIRLALQAGKGYSVTCGSQAGMPRLPLSYSEAKMGITPWRDTVRLAGTMELAGMPRAGRPLKRNRSRVDAIVRAARYLLPGFEVGEIQETWAGLRSLTPDGLPLIGRTGRISNLVVATGHAMLGVTQSVVTGRLVADLVVGNEPEVPLESFSPDRF